MKYYVAYKAPYNLIRSCDVTLDDDVELSYKVFLEYIRKEVDKDADYIISWSRY